MAVRRIVANLKAGDPRRARGFYQDFLGLDLAMDHDFILTFAGTTPMPPQVSVAREGGAGTPVPVVSVEVDDLDRLYERAVGAGFEIVYPMTIEPWGVRRFFVRDPFGNIVNILAHSD